MVKRVLYNDTETLMVRLQSHLLGSYVTDDLHTARISNDERVLYNDTETLMVRLLSHSLGSFVTRVLQIARISNNERVLYNFYLHKCMLDFNFRKRAPKDIAC